MGQEHILGEGKLLKRAIDADKVISLILYGPPGTGKTTLAHVIANVTKAYFQEINAVVSNVQELKDAIKGAKEREKAFGKTGEALTSVNAQRFENTRKALKEVARKGMEGKKAKALDESITDIYRVQDLVKKNAEAVNKLNQKIQERGLLERVGYYASKTLDMATGGSLRGVFGGLLPRGVGYKVMNALDLEKALQRNLEIIQRAIKAGDPEIIKLLRKVKEAGSVDKADPVQ